MEKYHKNYYREEEEGVFSQCGMTLRDWYAGMAMQGQINNEVNIKMAMETAKSTGRTAESIISDASYKIADAMMEARKK